MGTLSGFALQAWALTSAPTLANKCKNSRYARKAKRRKFLGKLRRRRPDGGDKAARYLFSNFAGRLAMKAAMPSFWSAVANRE
jgi:hypothetical protein